MDADLAARSRRGGHAFVHLFRVHRAVHGDGVARSRSPAPGIAEIPARPNVRGLLIRLRSRRCHLRGRYRLGDRAPLHPAALPHPHQNQTRRRGDPRHIPHHRRDRLLHRSRAHRARGPARVREMVVRRLPAFRSDQDMVPAHAQQHTSVAVGHPRRRVLGVPRDPSRHEAAPHVHVTHEHVSARSASDPRAR